MSGSLENLKHLSGNPNFFFKQFDITELGPFTEQFSTAFFDEKSEAQKFDQIYHMACPASPVTYQKDPVKTLMTSVLGAYNLLEIARTVSVTVTRNQTFYDFLCYSCVSFQLYV